VTRHPILAAIAPDNGAAPSPKESVADVKPIVVVDDDDWVCDSLRVLLESYGYRVLAYGSGVRLLADDRHRRAGVFIVDHHMPEMDGLAVIAALRREGVSAPTVLTTGRLDPGVAEHAAALGISTILEKPFTAVRLVETVRAGLKRHG